MKHNLVIKLLLLAIAGLLTVNLIRPLLSPSVTHAARPIQYKVVEIPPDTRSDQATQVIESLLNEYGKKRWELVAVVMVNWLIFKK